MADQYHLSRFVVAQAPVYASALAELRRGRKTGHWIWFILPQLVGLGHSPMARAFGIGSIAEAAAYLAHPTLGPRLTECVAALMAVEGRSAAAIMGELDALKLRSCLTLFAAAAGDPAPFEAALERYFGGEPDPLTIRLLAQAAEAPG